MIGCLKDKDGNPSAFWETILGHIDMKVRKTANFKSGHLDHLINLSESHKSEMHFRFMRFTKIY